MEASTITWKVEKERPDPFMHKIDITINKVVKMGDFVTIFVEYTVVSR